MVTAVQAAAVAAAAAWVIGVGVAVYVMLKAARLMSETSTTVAGLPLTLIILGAGIFPVLMAVGWFYNRHARQLEARFTHLVDPVSRRPDA